VHTKQIFIKIYSSGGGKELLRVIAILDQIVWKVYKFRLDRRCQQMRNPYLSRRHKPIHSLNKPLILASSLAFLRARATVRGMVK
jgi:hypothetical protein